MSVPPLDLSGRVAIVTGSARGVGAAEAIALAARGARVVCADIEESAHTVNAVRRLGGQAVPIRVDLGDPHEIQRLLDFTMAELGEVDILVNNAGILRDAMSFNMTLEDWDAVLAINLRAPFLLSKLCGQRWREQHKAGVHRPRSIVNTTSESGLYGNAGQSSYSASKAGLAAMTITTAAELDRYGVRVNAIAPRARTAMSASVVELPRDGDFDPFDPEHVGPFVAWLVSPAAAATTGQVFVVYGGGIELMEGWRPRRRLERGAPFSDDELLRLHGTLFEGGDGRYLVGHVLSHFDIGR